MFRVNAQNVDQPLQKPRHQHRRRRPQHRPRRFLPRPPRRALSQLGSQRLIDKRRPAYGIDLLRSRDVRIRDGLTPTRRGGLEDVHRLLQTGAARGDGAPRERDVEGQVVKVDVGGVGEVGDGVGVAVHGRLRVDQAAGRVERRVAHHGEVGVAHDGVAGAVVDAAVLLGDEARGEVREKAPAERGVGGARGVEDLCGGDEGALGFEEGFGALEEEGEGVALLEGRVGEERVDEERAGGRVVGGFGEVGREVAVEGARQRARRGDGCGERRGGCGLGRCRHGDLERCCGGGLLGLVVVTLPDPSQIGLVFWYHDP